MRTLRQIIKANVIFTKRQVMSIIINLPWLNPAQSNNVKLHWAVKAKHIKAERSYAYYKIKSMDITPGQKALLFEAKKLHLHVTFYPPNLRMDKQNMHASGTMKAYFDGIADGLGVNDRIFNPTYEVGAVEEGGRVNIEIMI